MIDKHKIDYEKISEYAKKTPDYFTYNRNIRKNSYMNWRTRMISDKYNLVKHNSDKHNLIVLADAYLDGAYTLLSICLASNSRKEADSLIFPILFNTIH